MNFANYKNSPRLQRLLAFLADGRARSTMEIIQGANIANVSSAVAELRFNGFPVACRPEGKIYYYSLGEDRRIGDGKGGE